MDFLKRVLRWVCRILAGTVLVVLAIAVPVAIVLLILASFTVPGVLVDNATKSLGLGVGVDLAILFVEVVLAMAVGIELTLKAIRFTFRVGIKLGRMVVKTTEEFFK